MNIERNPPEFNRKRDGSGGTSTVCFGVYYTLGCKAAIMPDFDPIHGCSVRVQPLSGRYVIAAIKSPFSMLRWILCGLMAVPLAVHGQAFITPVDEVPHSNQCYIALKNGSRIEGIVKSDDIGEGITAITLVTVDDERVKVSAADISELGVKATGLVKMELIAEGTETVKKLTRANFEEIANREYIIYQQALLPGKKTRYALLQLLNPGFDSMIKVFQDPWAVESTGLTFGDATLTGEEDKSYLFVKGGGQAFKVKKGTYKKEFRAIFGDCPKMLEVYEGEKLRFRDAALDVFVYDQICRE